MDIEIPDFLVRHCQNVGYCECANPFQIEIPAPSFSPEWIAERQAEIRRLKEKHQAIILAHNYQIKEIQDVADYVGDSLGLSREAAKTDAKVILFCGVNFMAETAKILNPDRTVILPDANAGCCLEECCPAEELRKLKEKHPELYVISYINCSSEVKTLSDVICTSGNADKIVAASPKDRPILFTPDQNLGSWVMEKTGREMLLWPGYCYVHTQFTAEAIAEKRKEYPEAKVVAHPECTVSVRKAADEVCSTEKMISYCRTQPAKEFIIVTEANIIHRLHKELPGKKFYPLPIKGFQPQCKHMMKNTLDKMISAFNKMKPQIQLPAEIMAKARAPIERMLELS
jgi:quinolinate synthase